MAAPLYHPERDIPNLTTSIKKFLSGNDAIAHATYRASCRVAAAYPGTPSTEILENVSKFKEHVYCEWSVNEKVSMEVAIGSSLAGGRALTAMKHVGLNVAADPLMTITYVGVNAGLVIISADDPGMHSSQNEQDNRFFARFAKVPLLEPCDSQESYDMTVAAFEISEQFDTPVIVRMTTRTSHCSGVVDLGDFTQLPHPDLPYKKDVEKNVPVPLYARKMRLRVEERLNKLAEYTETTPLNRIEPGGSEIGIVTSGVPYQYVKEVFPEASVLKLGFTNPLPRKMIEQFASTVKRLYVIEELDPFLAEQIRSWGVQVEEYKTMLHIGEMTLDRLMGLRAEIMGEELPATVSRGVSVGVPARPPVLCAGCGHRAVFEALQKFKVTVTGDIGCYSLGAFKPLEAMDTIVCMGASIGNAHGFEKSGYKGRTAAILGDSTFFHSGLTGLLDLIYNGGQSTIIILDNRTTAMTGHQDHPGSGKTLMGGDTPDISVEQVCTGLGAKRVIVVNCYDIAEVERVIKEEVDRPELSIIVAKAPCIVGYKVETGRKFKVSEEACIGCGTCLNLGCPAMELGEPDPDNPKRRKVKVNELLCAGCSMCDQICKFHAVEEVVIG